MLTWLNSHKGKIGLDITTNIEHILPTIQNINIRTIIVTSWHSFQWVSVLGSGLRRFDVRFFLVVISGCCFGGVELWLGVKLLLWIFFGHFLFAVRIKRIKWIYIVRVYEIASWTRYLFIIIELCAEPMCEAKMICFVTLSLGLKLQRQID